MSQNLSRVAPFLFGRRPFIAALVRTFHSSSSVYRSTLANSGSLASPVRGGHQPYQEGRPWSPCVKAAVSFASLSVALLSASAPVASCEEYGEDNTDFRGVFKSLESSVVLLYASPQGGNPPGTQIGTAFVYKEEKGRTYLISAAHTLRKRIGFAQGGVDPRLGDVLWVKLPVSGRWEEVKLEGKTEGTWACTMGGGAGGGDDLAGAVGIVSNPRQSFTEGSIDNSSRRWRFIQLSVTTLPGMSGSPAVTRDGRCIGMIVKKCGEFGLALPLQLVRHIADSITSNGYWSPPYLGMVITNRTDDGAGYGTQDVVRIVQVKGQTPAAKAGLKVGDVIESIDGRPVRSVYDVYETLGVQCGSPAELKVKRGEKTFATTVVSVSERRVW
ncbi:conserved hypothetical protein [Perkinsus marinus ATCC 50983]|uniref:PDZ domain-containing protein n=1 Tax=Perkinsus marinus (strain ATCC 50983 / TXsc) TaxID=423536 RepID=C5K718_PERM5|nr:conserved hypothetical protein [Perkinsus marinus ATCC 50983]EER19353.1 conserved hypothetical protein [Perkinsus marinus ATCC 50983]|eukprot:XP_002787557.1 conserved hypothetical protein [Perkinsus marinus ATCC 50983]